MQTSLASAPPVWRLPTPVSATSDNFLRIEDVHAPADSFSITDFGAVGDDHTLNTPFIQRAIDVLAAQGGGTLIVPKGVFRSGALFLKPGVHLHLEAGAVLRGSTDLRDYPRCKTRIEGQFIEWVPALLNADDCNGLRISGTGTLDGNGAPFWEAFWDGRRANPQITNLAVPRPRLMLIQNSQDVQISGITFKDSAFWNLHLYRCQNALVENVRFQVPDGVRCPSSDGTDIDSCQNVTIRRCTYRVDDDCIAIKGSKGPLALEDKNSPPVENIRVEDCTFERGHGGVTLGSEATIVRDVRVEKCHVFDVRSFAVLKLRPDTPQRYENICYRDITLEGSGRLVDAQPWRQFFDLKGQEPPQSCVRNITFSGIRGRYGSLGILQGNAGQTTMRDIALENVDVRLQDEEFQVEDAQDLRMQNVRVNGKSFSL